VLTSLALHALLLFALPFLQDAKRQIPARLTARLAPKPPEPVPPKLEPLPPQSRPAPHPPVIRPAPAAKAVPQPAVVPPTVPAPPAPILSVEPAKQASEPALVVPAAPPAPPPAIVAASGPDAGAVARFRLELMDLARRYKKYPRIAQDNNWQGRVELRIAIAEDGAISSLVVKKGAGRSVLDEEAQAMIRTAKSKATIPPGLRGKAFTLEIRVDFFLKDDER
jgi:protein TonB